MRALAELQIERAHAAATPDGQVLRLIDALGALPVLVMGQSGHRRRMAQAVCEPRTVEVRQLIGPPWHQMQLAAQDRAVQCNRIAHQPQPRLVHAVDEPRQVQAAKNARGQREHGGFVVHLLLRVAPVALLLRQHGHAGASGDCGVDERIGLVGGGLYVESAQHRIVGAHGAGTAVLDHHVGVLGADLLDPLLHRTAMIEQTLAHRIRVDIGAGTRRRVVVELEELHIELVDQAIHRGRGMGTGHRRAEVEVVAALIGDAAAVPAEERRIRQHLRQRRAHADHLRLQPQAGLHAMRLDVVDEPGQAKVAEAVGGGLPFTHHVPPAAIFAVVPAGVNAEHVGAHLGGALHERQLLFDARVAPQRVHVVVVNNEPLRLLRLFQTTHFHGFHAVERTPLHGHLGHGVLPVARADHERDRHRDEGLVVAQHDEPLVVVVFRPVCTHTQTRVVLADLPFPGTVVLDLPCEREMAELAWPAASFDNAHRLELAGGPCRRGTAGESGGRHALIDHLVTVAQRGGTQRRTLPGVLAVPRAFAPVDLRLRILEFGRFHGQCRVHRRHRLHRVWLLAAQPRVGSHRTGMGHRLEHARHQRAVAVRVTLHNREQRDRMLRIVQSVELVCPNEPQFETGGRNSEFQPVVSAAVQRTAQLHNRLRIWFAGDVLIHRLHAAAAHADQRHRLLVARGEYERHRSIAPYDSPIRIRRHRVPGRHQLLQQCGAAMFKHRVFLPLRCCLPTLLHRYCEYVHTCGGYMPNR